jgi:hypothetical protein
MQSNQSAATINEGQLAEMSNLPQLTDAELDVSNFSIGQGCATAIDDVKNPHFVADLENLQGLCLDVTDQAVQGIPGEEAAALQEELDRQRKERKDYFAAKKRARKEQRDQTNSTAPASAQTKPVAAEKLSQLVTHFGKKPTPARAALLLPPNRAANRYLQEAVASMPAREQHSEDGVDHINVGLAAKTRLGQELDLYSNISVHHPELGRFQSVAGLVNWVRSDPHNDGFRNLWGDKVRQAARREKMAPRRGIRVIAADAAYLRIMQHPELKQELTQSTLPFTNYFHYGEFSIRKTASEAFWYVDVLEEIRRVLVEGRGEYPNFDFLSKN